LATDQAKLGKQPGNILLVANYKSNVGYAWWLMESFWSEIAKYFEDNGRHCYLIFPKIGEVSEIITGAPIHVLEHDFDDRTKSGKARLRTIIKDNNISAVYLTDKKSYDSYYLRLRLWGVKYIVKHDHTPGERPRIGGIKRLAKQMIYKLRIFSCDHYIGVSRFVRDRLIDNGCIPPHRCSYVLNGIMPLNMRENHRGYANRMFGIPDEAIIVVSVARATFYKGIDFIIVCADKLINEKGEPNIYFLYCGDGPDLEEFKIIANQYELADRFIFAGNRTDIREILLSCHIGLQASRGEAFSLSILEYMSAGLATLVPDNCGNSEAIEHEKNGILYELQDRDTVVGTILRLIKDDNCRERLGQEATRTIREKFHIERASKELVERLAQIF